MDSNQIATLTEIPDIRRSLEKLRALERAEDEQLWSQLGRHNDLEVKMSALKRMGPKLTKLESDAQTLASTVGSTCNIAKDVSSKVRELDMIKSRLQETIERVDQVISLRSCADGVEAALRNNDLTQATQNIRRFLEFDDTVLQLHARSATDTAENTTEQLKNAHSKIIQMINEKFDEATSTGDLDEVQKIALLFPMVGELESGLAKYERFLASQTANVADAMFKRKLAGEDITHGKLAGKLVEGIAATIERETPFVTRHFGHGRMVSVMRVLQDQCDIQLNSIITQFVADHAIDRKVRLAQDVTHKGISSPSSNEEGQSKSEVDPQDLDPVIGELIVLIQRSEIICRFIRSKIEAALKEAEEGTIEVDLGTAAKAIDIDPALMVRLTADIQQRTQGLIGYYLPLEEHVLRAFIAKAVALNTSETPDSLTTTLIDDAFFVIQKSASRALSSLNADCLCAVLNQIRATLETEYLTIFRNELAVGLGRGSLADLTGALQSSIKAQLYKGNKGEGTGIRSQRVLLLALNNAAMSKQFTEKLMTDITNRTTKMFANAGSTDRSKISSNLSEFANSANQFEDLISEGLKQLCATHISSRIRTLTENMLSCDYVVSEEDLLNLDGGSPFVVDLITGLTKITTEYQVGLLPSNYDTLLVHISEAVAANLERVVLQVKFNRLGGVLFDKDLRILCNFLSKITQWTLRSKFSKCTQMATLLSLENIAEIKEFYGKGNFSWRLSPAQVTELLACRVDLDSYQVQNLQF